MTTKLYVGNLSFSVNSDELVQQFSAYGTVESANVITDRETGRSKGFAFVEMSTEAEAQAAMAGLDGTEIDGRSIRVNEAKPREERPRNSGRDSRRRSW